MEIPIKGGNHIVGIPVRVASRHDVVKPLSRYVNMYLGIPINTEGWGWGGRGVILERIFCLTYQHFQVLPF